MAELPVALAKDTIVECIFEMRFSGGHPSVEDLLPGLVFGKLSKFFSVTVPMPAGQVPRVLREQNEQMRYLPTHALQGPSLRMLFGPRSASVSFPKPYPGWAQVQPIIMECMTTVFDTQLIGLPERFAIKYVNLLNHGRDEFDLSQIRLKLELGEFSTRGIGTIVRAEILRNACAAVVEIASGAKIKMPVPGSIGPTELKGVLLSVDTSMATAGGADARADLPQVLETLHDTEKQIFFGLIAAPTLEKLNPIYTTSKH